MILTVVSLDEQRVWQITDTMILLKLKSVAILKITVGHPNFQKKNALTIQMKIVTVVSCAEAIYK